MKLNETLKQTVKKGYLKGKSFVDEHKNDIKFYGIVLWWTGLWYTAGNIKGKTNGYVKGQRKGYNAGYYVGTKNQEHGINEWIDGMDAETYNTVVEYDKKRHNPRMICNQK